MFDKSKICERIKTVANSYPCCDLSERELHDVAFHMTDWLADLEAFHSFCRDPESMGDNEIEQMLINFLVHVPNHVAAAAKLLADSPVEDIFSVGAVDMTYAAQAAKYRLRLEVWGDEQAEPTIEFPTHEEIEIALRKLDGERLFGARIGLTEIFAMQITVSKEPDEGGFEYWMGADENRGESYECTDRKPPIESVIRAFQQFALGNHDWKTDFDWKPSQ